MVTLEQLQKEGFEIKTGLISPEGILPALKMYLGSVKEIRVYRGTELEDVEPYFGPENTYMVVIRR